MLNGVGIYPDVPEDIYRNYKAVNQSLLQLCEQSRGHFKYWYDRIGMPAEETEKDDALIIGTAVHAAILEPNKFRDKYLNSNCYSKAKKEYKDCKAANPDKIVLSSKEYSICEGVLNSIASTKTARSLLEKESLNELVGIWDDPHSGLHCKLRADRYLMVNGKPTIIDVKTTTDASNEGFSSSIHKWGYHRQAAFYLDGMNALNAEKVGLHTEFIIIAVEKIPPFAVAVHQLTEEDIRDGRVQMRKYLSDVKRGFQTGEWPLYPDTIQRIRLPQWYYKQKQQASIN